MKKTVTLLFLRRGDEILLAMKKRGYGKDKWNGVGGKLETGEDALQAAIRECQEEINVTPLDPRLSGRLEFFEHDNPGFQHSCHVFVSDEWEGEPKETEEMRPRWFHIDAIPYDKMWPDDAVWLPHLLQGRPFSGEITVDIANDKLMQHFLTVHADFKELK